MKCPICNKPVLNNSDYSVHMNNSHRGQSYQGLYQANNMKKYGSSNTKRKTNVDSKVE
jgi:uncharacterized C2H2 Zn-finger protein